MNCTCPAILLGAAVFTVGAAQEHPVPIVTAPLRIPHADVYALTLSESGATLVTAGKYDIRIWRTRDGHLLKDKSSGHACPWNTSGFDTKCVHVSDNLMAVVTAGRDGNVVIWDMNIEKELNVLAPGYLMGQSTRPELLKRIPVGALAVSSDLGLACIGYGPIVSVWDVPNRKETARLGAMKTMQRVELDALSHAKSPFWSTRQEMLRYFRFCGERTELPPESISVWNVDLSKSNVITRIIISDDKRYVAACSMERVMVWDLQSVRLMLCVEGATSAMFSKSTAQLLTGGPRVGITIWSMHSWAKIRSVAINGKIELVATQGPDLIIRRESSIDVIDAESGRLKTRFADMEGIGGPRAVSVSTDGGRLATSWNRIDERNVRVWNIPQVR